MSLLLVRAASFLAFLLLAAFAKTELLSNRKSIFLLPVYSTFTRCCRADVVELMQPDVHAVTSSTPIAVVAETILCNLLYPRIHMMWRVEEKAGYLVGSRNASVVALVIFRYVTLSGTSGKITSDICMTYFFF